jgi:hypothetical protein
MMKRITMLVVTAALAFAFSLPVVFAQQPQHQHDATQQPSAPSAKPDTPGPAMDAHMAQHMEMCRQMMGQGGMMGGGMGPGMMGPGMMGGDPKQQVEMMAMRGEMMKAMGDIMMKYAQRMQSTK